MVKQCIVYASIQDPTMYFLAHRYLLWEADAKIYFAGQVWNFLEDSQWSCDDTSWDAITKSHFTV